MEDLILSLLALGLLVLIVVGAVAAILSLSRLRRVERAWRGLAARVAKLEAERGAGAVAAAEERAPELPLAEPQGAPPPQPVPEPAAPGGPPAAARIDWESLIAGRWLNRIGIVAVLLAVAFFLKYAFDNDWIGPAGRVAIGLLAGASLMAASQWFLGRGYRYFSEGIAALGAGVLFLSLYAAWNLYRLIPQAAAFAGMVLVTAALAGLALGRGSQRMAVLALLGGLATPGLLSTGVDRQVTLFGYLAILAAGFLTLAWRKRWRWLAPLALFGVLAYLAGWAERFYTPEHLGRTCFFATLFFALFTALPLLAARSGAVLRSDELLLLPANAAWYGVALHLMLYRDHRWWLTAAVLALGALHLLLARAAPRPDEERRSPLGLVLAGLALTFATAAVPIRLEGEWITIAWAAEGALLVWAGFKTGLRPLRLAGIGLLLVVVLLLLYQYQETERFLLNERFASFAAAVAAMALSGAWARTHRLPGQERRLFGAVAIAANALAVWGLSEEVWQLLGRQRWDLDPRLARQMGLSLLWALAAGALILVGARRRSKPLRWQGLLLLGLAVGKVFLLDLSFLQRAYRITSFLVLGLVLLAVSFWYQRRLAGGGAESGAEGEGDGA